MYKTINFHIPTCWNEMTQEQLRFVFATLALNLDIVEVQMLCFMKFAGCKLSCKEGDEHVTILCKDDSHKLSYEQVMDGVYGLNFISEIPSYPIHMDLVDGHGALVVDFQDVPFETYLYCDNLYQGYLQTQDEGLLLDISKVLYECDNLKPNKGELISVFYWFASLKQMFSSRFSHFLKPGESGNSGNIAELLQDSMNAQIRALTKGYITKEKEVLSMDTWRALTELDAQAKEYEQLSKAVSSK